MKSVFRLLLGIPLLLLSCKSSEPGTPPSGYQGQGPTPLVSTKTKPVQRQWKGTWALKDSTVFFTNAFDGARLNGVAHDGGNHFTIWITAENTPINVSPWYAFKVWGTQASEIEIEFAYQDIRSRYYPKISTDGLHFTPLDSLRYREINPGEGEFGIKAAPEAIAITIPIKKEPTWVSAQELYPSSRVNQWIDSLAQAPFIAQEIIGYSREGRAIRLMEIKASEAKKSVVVITRQHPPEVTGFLAMKSFVETLAGDSPQAKIFRERFTVYNVPLVNPDGVDNGHWRHNMGGIDLNRDWSAFHQPETRAIRDFLMAKKAAGQTFEFGVDFHSTWDDIYYPLDTVVTGERGKIVFDWITAIGQRLPGKKTNVSASTKLEPTMVSRNHFFKAHDMPSIVFELGDNTPRWFLKEKGKVAAEELMRLLMAE